MSYAVVIADVNVVGFILLLSLLNVNKQSELHI